MTDVSTAAGSKLYIGTTSGNILVDTYVEVNEVVSIGAFGRVYDEITHTALGNRNVLKFKGQRNDGNIELELGRDSNDAGQLAMTTALDSDYDYNFQIVLNDKSSTSGSHSTQFFFKGKVMGIQTNVGGSNNVVSERVTIGLKSGTLTNIPAT